MTEELQWLIGFFIALIGLSVGSFLNVVIYRLPREERLDKPSSHCTSCGHAIRWYDNIPVLSYLLLGGKCRDCKAHISIRYTLVELANLLLWICCMLKFGITVYSGLCMLLCSLLLVIFFIDLEHQIVCDSTVIGILLVGALMAIFCPEPVVWYDRLIGGGAAFLFFLLLFYGSQLILKKEALGGGDVKLMGACGLALGWQNVALGTFLGAIIGCVYLLIASALGKLQSDKPIPFAPMLTAGVAIALFFGQSIIGWYLGLFL